MDVYKLLLLLLMFVLALAQDIVASSVASAGALTAAQTIADSFGQDPYSKVEILPYPSISTGAGGFIDLERARSTVYSTSIVYVSYTNVFATTVLPQSTTTAVITLNVTSTASVTSTILSTELSTTTAVATTASLTSTLLTTEIYTSTAVTTISTISTTFATGLCHFSSQDALTPCTAAVVASPTLSSPTISSASASSPAIRNRPNGLFRSLGFLKRRAVGANRHEKRDQSCSAWQASIVITAFFIAFTLVSILCFATIIREKREQPSRIHAYKWWVYAAQAAFLGLLIWLLIWSAMATVGNGCN
ncbi:uncharacterized protein EAF01_004970 [Botrytis porri]|uniref:Uncharacterized protein n=1 Tax=Botrytis porri TaxID=87229 RepID=A0A4Z1L2I6_9HELO|nr:uncharacterized protein EAF01_004970 [Botrytis porri]KAF7907383.1 hypothetical protein EAF01_004970 [Botrytis porri]TGO90793.1 hypothetical protein BPOR_0051g00280 [Botrytis porri]